MISLYFCFFKTYEQCQLTNLREDLRASKHLALKLFRFPFKFRFNKTARVVGSRKSFDFLKRVSML